MGGGSGNVPNGVSVLKLAALFKKYKLKNGWGNKEKTQKMGEARLKKVVDS